MSPANEQRADLIRRCRVLTRRFAALGSHLGESWARQWAESMLDNRTVHLTYVDWIEQQEARADRLEQRALAC